jgi:hypothetical protein
MTFKSRLIKMYDKGNVCQSPPFFSIHQPFINAVKYSSILYVIQCPAGQQSCVLCAQTTTI